MVQRLKQFIDHVASGRLAPLPCPFPILAKATQGFCPRQVILLCGEPGASKTFFALQCLDLWYAQCVPAAYFTLEENKDYYLFRLLAMKENTPQLMDLNWVRNHSDKAHELIDKNEEYLTVMAEWITDATLGAVNYSQLCQWCVQKAKDGARALVIDPVTAVTKTTPTPWKEDEEFVKWIVRLAASKDLMVLLITHPVKTANNDSSGRNLDRLYGSAAFSRFAQTVVWLEGHADIVKRIASDCGSYDAVCNRTIHVLKARNGAFAGIRIGCEFEQLKLKEFGVILRKDNV